MMADDTRRDQEACITVTLPPALLRLFPEASSEVEFSAATVGEMIDCLEARWPGMRDRICDSRPGVRRHINIFVDSKRATLATELQPGTRVNILTAVSGG